MTSLHRYTTTCAAVALAGGLTACAFSGSKPLEHEEFNSTNTYSRTFPASDAQTCEAARRALLSQGYVIGIAKDDQVQGRKSFQPERETHVEIDFRVVCATDGKSGRSTIAFVNALQDRYALKKSNNSASVGVGIIGSVSLPFSSSDDSLVKVSSETVTASAFYDRFFVLMSRYMLERADHADPMPPAASPASAPAAAAAPASEAAAL